MPITTYAQNFEDVLLWRALGHVEHGFYVDIGAQDPNSDSVSKLFYQHGWRGIHVEASSYYAELLRRERPDELVVQALVAAENGLGELYEFQGTGLSTAVKELAYHHHEAGWKSSRIPIPSITMDSLFEDIGKQDIHWLKIDVEGYEGLVIDGWRSAASRPWAIVIEAVTPTDHASSHETYESQLLAKGYHLVHFDGLNRYYVSDLHAELDAAFQFGPSVWDEIQVPRDSRMAQRIMTEMARETDAHQERDAEQVAHIAQLVQERDEQDRGRLALEQEIEALKGDVAAIGLRAENVQGELERASTALFEFQSLAEQLTGNLSTVEQARNELEVRLQQEFDAHLEAERAKQDVVRNSAAQLAETTARLSVSDAVSMRLSAELAAAESRYAEVQKSLARSLDLLAGAEEHARVLTERWTAAEACQTRLQEKLERSQAWLIESESKIGILGARLSSLEASHQQSQFNLASARTALDEQVALLAIFSDQREEVTRQLTSARQENSALCSEVDALRHALAQEVDRSAALTSELSQSRKISDDLSIDLDASEQNLSAALVEVERQVAIIAEKDELIKALSGQRPVDQVEVLIAEGNRAFVNSAYYTLLGRAADDGGIRYYLDRLERGQSRESIIYDLAHSPEGLSFASGAQGLTLALDQQRTARIPIFGTLLRVSKFMRMSVANSNRKKYSEKSAVKEVSVCDLLNKAGENFVSQAYQTVLGRSPDEIGKLHFLWRLEQGHARLDILAALRWSEEGRLRAAIDPQIDAATGWFPWRRVWIVGRWRRDRALKRFMPPMPQRLGAMLDEIDRLQLEGGGLNLRLPDIKLPPITVPEISCLVPSPSGSEGRQLTTEEKLGLPAKVSSPPPNNEIVSDASAEPGTLLDGATRDPFMRAQQALVKLMPEMAFDNEAARMVAILCDKTVPVPPASAPMSIWYAVGDAEQQISVNLQLGKRLQAIACEAPADARHAINQGIGIAAVPVGKSERDHVDDPAGWQAIAQRLANLADDLLVTAHDRGKMSHADCKFRIGVVTTWNEKCGIATHSEELLRSFSGAQVEIYAPHSGSLLRRDKKNVRRSWSLGKHSNNLSNIVTNLRHDSVDLLLIQFNYGFFNHDELSDLIQSAANLKTVVVLILHSTADPMDAPNWRLSDMLPALRRCGRIIVHTERDVRRLLELGLEDNVVLLPHGIERKKDVARWMGVGETPLISTFGFSLPNKGLVEIIEAVGLLRDRGVKVSLKMVNAQHSDPSSAMTLDAMRKAVSRLHLDRSVKIVSSFLEISKAEKLVASADLFVNPYQETGESASGAVRLGMRLGLPTLVTPLPIFDDLGNAVFRAEGASPEALADGIERALGHLRDQDKEAHDVRQALDAWLLDHDFETQTKRLRQICRSLQAVNLLSEQELRRAK